MNKHFYLGMYFKKHRTDEYRTMLHPHKEVVIYILVMKQLNWKCVSTQPRISKHKEAELSQLLGIPTLPYVIIFKIIGNLKKYEQLAYSKKQGVFISIVHSLFDHIIQPLRFLNVILW